MTDQIPFGTPKTDYYPNGKMIDGMLGAGLVTSDFLSHNFTKRFEEAFWRGMIYEELKYRFDKSMLPRILSSALFGLWHIAPMYTEYQYPANQIPLNILGVMLSGYVISIIYDNFGLEITVSTHAWFNSTMGILNHLFFSRSFKKDETVYPNQQLRSSLTI